MGICEISPPKLGQGRQMISPTSPIHRRVAWTPCSRPAFKNIATEATVALLFIPAHHVTVLRLSITRFLLFHLLFLCPPHPPARRSFLQNLIYPFPSRHLPRTHSLFPMNHLRQLHALTHLRLDCLQSFRLPSSVFLPVAPIEKDLAIL